MLEACGLRGFAIGGAQISPKHANFIENAGEARSADAIALIAEARRRAREQFGVVLQPEVQLLGAIEIPPLEEWLAGTARSSALFQVGPRRWAANSVPWLADRTLHSCPQTSWRAACGNRSSARSLSLRSQPS